MTDEQRVRRRSFRGFAWGLVPALTLVAGAAWADNVGANGEILDPYKRTLSSVGSGLCLIVKL